jgi:UDP-N-acetylenolpyruvoylglucosamine reductase
VGKTKISERHTNFIETQTGSKASDIVEIIELVKENKTAHDILVKANVKKELKIAPITRKLKDVANAALK